MSVNTKEPKIATAGKLEIAINHFTTDITQLPYWMDSNCYIVFSLLWRRYISASINEKLITPDGWFQYTMKSLLIHCGFKDKGTLQRAVEGLFRSGLIDVRVEAGSRMWACWKMNKKNIEYVASIPDRDAMQEPFLNSINTIGSRDRNFTYQLNKEGITELMKFLGQNVRYPEEAHKNNIQGRVIATFVVEKDGSISEASVAKSVDPLLDEEALRVVSSMPNWIPGRQNGEPVRVKYTVPITFKLQGDAKPAKENAITLGKEHNGKGFTLVIDGKAYDLSELNSINPADIDSVRVEKAKDGRSNDRVIIKMKKKK